MNSYYDLYVQFLTVSLFHLIFHPISSVDSIEAVLGAHYLNKKEKTQVHKVVNNTNFKIHPHYNESTLENDIALLKLPKPVKLNENVNVIKIATELDVENLNMTGRSEFASSVQIKSEECALLLNFGILS